MRTSYTECEVLTQDDVGLVFKSRDGQQWRLVCINDEVCDIVLINKNNNDYRVIRVDGREAFSFSEGHDDPYDLVSFVGPDFTEERPLRKFEFEGYIDRDFNSTDIENIYSVIIFKEKLLGSMPPKKYKITMEELPDAPHE